MTGGLSAEGGHLRIPAAWGEVFVAWSVKSLPEYKLFGPRVAVGEAVQVLQYPLLA